MDFWISDWISGFHSGFLDFSLDFWISGFQFGFLQTVYEISFVTDPSALPRKQKSAVEVKVQHATKTCSLSLIIRDARNMNDCACESVGMTQKTRAQ